MIKTNPREFRYVCVCATPLLLFCSLSFYLLFFFYFSQRSIFFHCTYMVNFHSRNFHFFVFLFGRIQCKMYIYACFARVFYFYSMYIYADRKKRVRCGSKIGNEVECNSSLAACVYIYVSIEQHVYFLQRFVLNLFIQKKIYEERQIF